LTFGYAIYSESGELLYWTYQTDGPEESWPRLGTGRVVIESQLPRRLLNEGTYRVELIASLHFRSWILQPGANAPHLFLTIQGGLSDSPYWMNRRPGLLAPEVAWTVVDSSAAARFDSSRVARTGELA
jgi:lipopolysaccharide transport system ATP-binding protein